MNDSPPPTGRPPVTEQEAERLGRFLLQTRIALQSIMERGQTRYGCELRLVQMQAILRLGGCGAMTAGELARAVGHDPGAMTRVVDQLVEKGLLTREPHESDRRALRIALTAAGQKTYGELSRMRREAISLMLRDLEADERETLMFCLERMLQSLGETADAR